MHIRQIQKNLNKALENTLKTISHSIKSEKPKKGYVFEVDIPRDLKHGDLTTNIALRAAKSFFIKSMELADIICSNIKSHIERSPLKSVISKVEVLQPGFINFWLSEEYLSNLLTDIEKESLSYGKSDIGKGEKVNVEFVSANPTGPLTVAHGRQAAVGDALSRILEFSGYKVSREYFVNDVGTQITLLGRSIYARYLELEGIKYDFPVDGYHGTYIKDIAKLFSEKYRNRFVDKEKKGIVACADFGSKYILQEIEADLEAFHVKFNVWSSQKKILPKTIKSTLGDLESKGYVYHKDGASWFRSTAFGDDKDRVVVKSDGSFTYLAPDIVYHKDKFRRKFTKLIDIWGPDHHGYIPRIKAAVEALGHDKDALSVLIVQLATLYRKEEALSMSTRKGEFIMLREVMNEVGCDVARFFFLMRKLDSHLDFDLEVAKNNSLDNPVYYIQYAHARIASIFDFGKKISNKLKTRPKASLLNKPEEAMLVRMLSQFPMVVETAARTLEPYRLVDYMNELAKLFHSFYTKYRVVSEDDLPLTSARLLLVRTIKIVLASGLGLLGVSLPERM